MLHNRTENKLKNYKILSGLNSRGTLWIAEDISCGDYVVIRKVLATECSVFRYLQQIPNPFCANIHDVIVNGDNAFIIEEFIEGTTLAEFVEEECFAENESSLKPPLSDGEILSVFMQILSALEFFHSHNIIHRDLKPQNIMISDDGTVKIIDFHIARFHLKEKGKDTSLRGTQGYAPPEQFGFSQTDPRSDIYAFGITMKELLQAGEQRGVIYPKYFYTFLDKCTEADPHRRYQSCSDAISLLNTLKRKRFQKKPFYFMAAIILLILAIPFTVILKEYFPEDKHENDIHESSMTETIPVPPRDIRAIWITQNTDLNDFPAILLSNGEKDSTSWQLGDGEMKDEMAKLSWQTGGDCLELTIAPIGTADIANKSSDTENNMILRFEDFYREEYLKNGTISNPPENAETVPLDYELLFHDINKDGKEELTVTLARRTYISSSTDYFLAEYFLIWTVYQTDSGDFKTSEPLCIADGYRPSFSENGLLMDSSNNVWGFQDGEWVKGQ